MEQISGKVRHFQSTRRWPRHQVDLSVRIIALNGILTTPVPARGSEISRAGMALHATVASKPGDLMQLQFPTSTPSRVKAVVRNRTGECLGLEFVTQLPPDNEARDRSRFLPSSVLGGSPELRKSVRDSCNPQTLYAGLRRKREELRQVQREIEALNMAILLLADDEKELSRLSVPGWLELDTRPWPGFSVSAPSARKTFLDDMGVSFSKGDEIALTGSKVKQGEADLILAREVVKGNDTFVLRDDKGNPVWSWHR